MTIHRPSLSTRPPRSLKTIAMCLAVGSVGVSYTAFAQPEIYGHPDSSGFYLIPPDSDDWTRHFSIGPLAAFNISAKFNIVPGQFFSGISGNNVAAGIFDNGYVRTDQTGNAGGLTGYWGYNNASQYNAANNTLTMSAVSSYSIPAGENLGTDVDPLVGVDAAYGVNFWYWKHARVGFDLGLSYLPLHVADHQTLSATVNQTSYVFPTYGITMPGAGYQGNSTGSGEPLIGSSYTSSSQSSAVVNVTGTRTLDANIFILRLGPTFYWDLGEHVGMNLGAGPALGVVSAEYSYNEIITINGAASHNVGSFDDLSFQYGGYVDLTLYYHLSQNVDLYLGGRYMMLDDYSISNGGRQASLDLGGQIYISAGLNWPF